MASALTLQGCAHGALDRKVDGEVAQETAIKTRADLRSETGQLIQSSPGLTTEQRTKLSALRVSTGTKSDELYSETLKLRSVLIKDLITTNYNEDEVELIKQRIKQVEDERLSLTFSAVTQANTILGRAALANAAMIEGFWGGRNGGRP